MINVLSQVFVYLPCVHVLEYQWYLHGDIDANLLNMWSNNSHEKTLISEKPSKLGLIRV